MFKSLLCRQIYLVLVFKNISKFDGQEQIIGNSPLPNLNQQNIVPPNASNKEEENPILQQIDDILSEQVRTKNSKTKIDPNLLKFFDKVPKIFDHKFTEENKNQRKLNVSLDLNQLS